MTTTATTSVPSALDLVQVELPGGTLSLVRTPEDDVVRATSFNGPAALLAALPPALQRRGLRLIDPPPSDTDPKVPGLSLQDSTAPGQRLPAAEAKVPGLSPRNSTAPGQRLPAADPLFDAFARYSAGDAAALDRIRVEQPGTPFFQEVWRVMRQVSFGRTITYTELAAAAGRPRAVRAAASACARNQLCVVVPCHRILRSDGSLGGYAYGLDVKRALLDHEAAG